MVHLIIPAMATIVGCTILFVLFKDKEKVDKGFKLNYFQLSYRRKFIRTIIISPLAILAIVSLYLFPHFNMVAKLFFALFILVLLVGQLSYNYYMWKQKEQV